jgi:hypothetical protein
MSKLRVAQVEGKDFCCGLLFHFDPLTCTRAAPKVERLFLHKTIEACERIAKEHGFAFRLLPAAD